MTCRVFVVAWLVFCVFFLLPFCQSIGRHKRIEPYDLPVLPASLQNLTVGDAFELILGSTSPPSSSSSSTFASTSSSSSSSSSGSNASIIMLKKFIPRHVWIAVRNISDALPAHMKGFQDKNKAWQFHFSDNDAKDNFMEEHYPNSSILWAYHMLNPAIGCSKPEIWRLAVLFKFGGMYMDDDANIGMPLDDIVRPEDKMICGREVYNWDDRCYIDSYPISNHSLNLRFGLEANSRLIFNGKFFFNWAMFSAPGHPVIRRTMEHIVNLIKAEYLGESLIKMSPHDHRGKLLMCATTFPITLSARELVLENFPDLGLRTADFLAEFAAEMKAWFNDHSPTHWVKMIHKRRVPYLRDYAPPRVESFEGRLVQAPGQREIFLVLNGTKHGFPNMDTFLALKYDLGNVHAVPHAILSALVQGDLVDKNNPAVFEKKSEPPK